MTGRRNNYANPVDRRNHYAYGQITVEMETGTSQMEIDMTASNIATLVDDAAVLNNEIKLLTAKLDAIKAQFKQAGVGEYEGHLATVTISQNKDTEGFDYKKAFEHVSEHISSQLLTATKKKFATVKAGAKVMNIDLKLAVAA